MKPSFIVSDWNGTLITDLYDGKVLEQIGMDELKRCVFNPLRWWQVSPMYGLMKDLQRMVTDFKADPTEERLGAVYEVFNRNVLAGMPMHYVDDSIERYARKAVGRLDPAFGEFFEAEAPHVILTSALGLGVMRVIRKSKQGFGLHCGVHGSTMKMRLDHDKVGVIIADSVELRNYDGKDQFLDIMARRRGLDTKDVTYMGNDSRDEPCAKVAGIFVVPPLATDDFRQHMTSEYGSRVRTPSRNPGEVYRALTMD